MFTYSSNAESVFVRLQRDLVLAETNLEDHLRRGAVDSVALISNRIQQQGMNADGNRMETKARLRSGAYSKQWAKNRSGRGREIDHVDFTDAGDLMRSFQPLTVTPRLATAGFLDDRQADKAGYLEAYFGPAFYLSDTEQGQVSQTIIEGVLDDLEGR